MTIKDQDFLMSLKPHEINMTLETLGQRPHAKVYGLGQKRQQQALQPMQDRTKTEQETIQETQNDYVKKFF